MSHASRVLDPHMRRSPPAVRYSERGVALGLRRASAADAAQTAPPRSEAAAGTHGPRPVEPWKVRWCVVCRRYEYDVGAHRGWVPLRGAPSPEVVEYLSALQPAPSPPHSARG